MLHQNRRVIIWWLLVLYFVQYGSAETFNISESEAEYEKYEGYGDDGGNHVDPEYLKFIEDFLCSNMSEYLKKVYEQPTYENGTEMKIETQNLCFTNEVYVSWWITSGASGISIVSLILTLTAYFATDSKHLHGLCLILHAVSLLLFYFFIELLRFLHKYQTVFLKRVCVYFSKYF
jgi:hypothetical protein